MQDKKVADAGRKYNSMKNKVLAAELKRFSEGNVKDTKENRAAFQKLISVIIGRLNTL